MEFCTASRGQGHRAYPRGLGAQDGGQAVQGANPSEGTNAYTQTLIHTLWTI